MRILLIYPGHSIATIDVAIGYDVALRNLGHNVCSYMYHDALAYHTVALEAWKEACPEFQYSKYDLLKIAGEGAIWAAVEHVPDVVIMVSGFSIHPAVPLLLGPRLCLPLVLIATEAPYLDEAQAEMARHVDLLFTNERNSAAKMLEMNENTVYLPHSFNPEAHYPQEVPEEYQTDVLFWGTLYPERQALFNSVDWTGINEKIVGTRLVNDRMIDAISNDELAKFYSGTKIALSMNRTVIGVDVHADVTTHIDRYDAWSLGPRAYEIAGCGAFQLSDDSRGELREVFGDSVVTFKDADDLQEKVRWFLDHDQEREDLARESRQRVQACSFERRAQEILLPEIVRRC